MRLSPEPEEHGRFLATVSSVALDRNSERFDGHTSAFQNWMLCLCRTAHESNRAVTKILLLRDHQR